ASRQDNGSRAGERRAQTPPPPAAGLPWSRARPRSQPPARARSKARPQPRLRISRSPYARTPESAAARRCPRDRRRQPAGSSVSRCPCPDRERQTSVLFQQGYAPPDTQLNGTARDTQQSVIRLLSGRIVADARGLVKTLLATAGRVALLAAQLIIQLLRLRLR